MAEPQHQTLSDLMDGELDPDQVETVLDALCRDEALAAEWRRMHRIRDLMRGEAEPGFDVSAAVRQALVDEPAYLLPATAPARVSRHWPRYAIGGALAASVALATVVGIRQWQAPGATGAMNELAATSGLSTTATLPVAALSPPPAARELTDASAEVTAPVLAISRAVVPTAAHQPSRLKSYWAAHADNALLAGQESLNPLLRNVSVDSQQ